MKHLYRWLVQRGAALSTRFSSKKSSLRERLYNIVDETKRTRARPLIALALLLAILSGTALACTVSPEIQPTDDAKATDTLSPDETLADTSETADSRSEDIDETAPPLETIEAIESPGSTETSSEMPPPIMDKSDLLIADDGSCYLLQIDTVEGFLPTAIAIHSNRTFDMYYSVGGYSTQWTAQSTMLDDGSLYLEQERGYGISSIYMQRLYGTPYLIYHSSDISGDVLYNQRFAFVSETEFHTAMQAHLDVIAAQAADTSPAASVYINNNAIRYEDTYRYINAVVHNNSDMSLTLPCDYTLERYSEENRRWEKVAYNGTPIFSTYQNSAPAHSDITIPCDIDLYAEYLESGYYRMYFSGTFEDGTTSDFSTYFKIFSPTPLVNNTFDGKGENAFIIFTPNDFEGVNDDDATRESFALQLEITDYADTSYITMKISNIVGNADSLALVSLSPVSLKLTVAGELSEYWEKLLTLEGKNPGDLLTFTYHGNKIPGILRISRSALGTTFQLVFNEPIEWSAGDAAISLGTPEN